MSLDLHDSSFCPKQEGKRRRVERFRLLKMWCVARVIENHEPSTANSVSHLCTVLRSTNTIMPPLNDQGRYRYSIKVLKSARQCIRPCRRNDRLGRGGEGDA